MGGLLDRYIEYCWNLDKATLANTNFITWLTKEQGVLDLNTAKTTALRLATVALNTAVSMIAGIALNTIITKFNEWRTAIETNAQKSKELSSSMTDLISQYKELGDKSGWDTDDFAQAKDLNAEILDLLKNQSAEMDKKLRKLDLENGKYQEQIDLLNELSISTLTQNKADQGKLLEQTAKGKSSGQYVIGDSSDTDMANALGGKFGGSLDSNTGVFNFGGFDPNDADSILAYYDKLSNALDYLGSNYDSATLEASSLYNQLKSEKNAIEDQANAYRSSSDTLKEVIVAQKLSSTSSKRSEEDIKAVTDALEGLKGAYGGITSGNLVNFLSGDKKLGGTYADALNQLKEVMLNLGFEDNASDAQAFVDVLVQLGIVSSSSASKVDGLSESASAAADQLKEATDGLDKIQSAYSTLSDVVDEYNENGYLTVSTLTDLINLGPEYYNCLVDESGQLAINTENINTMADAYYEMAKAALYAQAIESLDANTNTYANASKFLATAEKQVTDMKSLLYAHSQELIDQGGLTGDALATQVKAQRRIINTYGAMIDLLDKTHAQSAENQFKDPNSKSSKSSSGNTTDPVSAWKTMTAAMEEYNKQGALCVSTLTDLMGLEDEYTSLLNVQDDQMSIDTTSFKNLMLAEIAQANALDDSGKSAEEFKKILEWVDDNVKGDTISYYELVAAIEGYSAALDEAKTKTDAFKGAWDNGKTVKETLEKSRTGALDYEGTEAQSSALQTIKEYGKYDPQLFEKAYNQETGKIDLSGDVLKEAVANSLEEQAKAARSEGGEAAEAIAKSYETSAKNIREDVISVQDYFDGLGSTIDEVNTKIDDIQSAFTDLDDVTNEYNAYGGLSIDSMQKLLTMQPEYLACLQMNGGQLEFNRDKMVELLIAQLESRKEFLASKEETKAQAEIIQQMIDALKKDGVNAIAGMTYEADKLSAVFSNIKDLFSSLLGLVNDANDKKSNDLKIQGDAWIDVIDKRIDAINEQNDAQERALELQKLQDAYEKAKANKTVRVYTSNGYEWQADESAVREARSNLNDKIRENRKQDQIDKLTKLKEEIQKNIDLIGTSWDDYQKKLAYTAQFEAMTYDEMVAHNDTFANAVIANMKAVQAATNVSNIISKLETLIDVLTKLGNVLGSFNGSTSNGGLAGLGNRFKNALSVFTDKSSGKGFFGRLGDSIKTFFGFGSGGSGSSGGNGFINTIANFFGNAKTTISNAAQSIFSGENGLLSIFQKGFGGVVSVTKNAIGGLGKVFGTIGTAVKTNGLFSTVIGIFGKLGATVTAAGGTLAKVAGLAISKIPVIGPLLLGGTLALGAIGGGSVWNGVKKIGSAIGNVFKGIGKTVAKVAKGIGSALSKAVKGIGGFLFGKTKSDGTKSRGVLGTAFHVITAPIRWVGKLLGFASGTKKVEQTGTYNVDEQGEEMIVRQPEKGRVTTLEKGDGVIPANQTATLMSIARNPIKWLRKNLAKVTGSTAAALGATENDSDQEAIAQAQDTADKIDSVYSGAFRNIKSVSNSVLKAIKSGSGTIGKFVGGISGLLNSTASNNFLRVVSGSVFSKIGRGIGKVFEKFKNMLNGTSSISTMSDLLTGSKKKTLAQLDAMKKSFEDTWNSMAEATGASKDDITKTSAEMYDRVNKLVNDTYAAINDNTGMSATQVEEITKSLFTSMNNIYTSGWNKIASTTSEMTEENANTIAAAYKKSHDSCDNMMNSTAETMKNGWSKVGGGVRNLSAKTENTISQAWADTSGDTEKMLYDMRACFDSSWGMAENGVKRLADGTESTLENAYTTIKSTSGDAFNSKLPSDAANAWKNVEPGAKDLQQNLTWVMDQAYASITKGCEDTVSSIKNKFSTTGDELYNIGQTKNTTTSSSSSSNSSSSSSSSSGSSGGGGGSSSTQVVNSNGKSLKDWWTQDMSPALKETGQKAYNWASNTYNSAKEKISNSSVGKAVSNVVDSFKESSAGKALSSAADKVKESIGSIFKKKAVGARKINESNIYNVDEQGPELMVRQPQAGRYTYLETGDGVVPADITSRLFEMGGNPDAWFQNQLSKYSFPVTSTGGSNMSVSMGNIVIQNPVGSAADLSDEIIRELPNKLSQKLNMR